MSKRAAVLLVMFATGAAGLVGACVDERAPLGPKPDFGVDPPRPEAGADDAAVEATILVTFDAAAGELPEGLTVLPDGQTLVGLSLAGRIVRVVDGGVADYAVFTPFTEAILLGLASDSAGSVYAAVGALDAGATPAPGIYRVPPDGGTPVPFSVPTTPPMILPNGIDVVGADLYVTDSLAGRIFKIDPAGNAVVWAERSELLGRDGGVGAKGITHDDASLYVTNIDEAFVLRYALAADAAAPDANAPIRSHVDRVNLGSPDGIVQEGPNRFLVASNAQDRIVRLVIVPRDAGDQVSSTIPYDGEGFDRPASLAIRGRELLFTNSAFRKPGEDAGPQRPSLASVPLPP